MNARSQLTWAHYRILVQVGDRAQRKAIESQAVRNNGDSHELEEHIRRLALPNGAPVAPGNVSGAGPKPLAPKRGTVGVYRIDTGRNSLAVDLGFTSYLDLTATKPGKWDRYLSDVYLKLGSGEDMFLNNVLLENGHAVRKDRYALEDWEAEVRL